MANDIVTTNEGSNADTTQETNASANADTFKYEGERYVFGPAEMDKAGELAQKINATVPVIQYPGANWPNGAGVALIPMANTQKRTVLVDGKPTEEKYRKTHAVLAWPIFPLDQIIALGAEGAKYLENLTQADQMQRILGPIRKQEWDNLDKLDLSSIVDTLQAHIEGQQAGQGIVKAFNDAAIKLLPSLKKMHKLFAAFTPQQLRQYLSSKALATAFNADIEAKGFWLGIIDKLEAITKEAGGPVEIYQQWRDTRDEATIDDLDTISLDNL